MLYLSYVSHETMQIGAKPKHAKTAGVLTQIGLTTYSRTICISEEEMVFFFFSKGFECYMLYLKQNFSPFQDNTHASSQIL